MKIEDDALGNAISLKKKNESELYWNWKVRIILFAVFISFIKKFIIEAIIKFNIHKNFLNICLVYKKWMGLEYKDIYLQ